MGNARVNRPEQLYRMESLGAGRYAVSGALTLPTAASALLQGERLFGDQPRIDIDLSGVDAADSAGLAVLLEWVRTSLQRRRRLVFHGLPTALAAIAAISEVEDILKAAES
jgi:phospholipid transport system transporter-binding protein